MRKCAIPGCSGYAVQQRLEEARRLERPGVGLVGEIRREIEGQGVEDLCFDIRGIALDEPCHRLFIGDRALPPPFRAEVGVKQRRGFDVIALALRLRADRPRLFDCRLTLLHEARCGLAVEGVQEPVDRDAPPGHGAARVLLGYRGKGLEAFGKPEGVQQGNPALELRLDCGLARGREAIPSPESRAGGHPGSHGRGRESALPLRPARHRSAQEREETVSWNTSSGVMVCRLAGALNARAGERVPKKRLSFG